VTFAQRFVRAQIVSQLAIAIISIGVGLIFGATVLLDINSDYNSFGGAVGLALAGATFAYLFGCLLVIPYGAPMYAFIESRGWATWRSAAAIGTVPGVALLALSAVPEFRDLDLTPALASIALVSSVVVAVVTHVLYQRSIEWKGVA
jgi:hypothetical protein